MPKLRMFPFDEVTKNSKVAIYGSGVIFDEFLSQVNALNYCEIIWVIDKKISGKYKEPTNNILFCSPDEMDWSQPEHIIIASIEYTAEIENELFHRKGNLDNVISLSTKNIVDIKLDYQDEVAQQQRKVIERGNIYFKRCPELIVSLTSIASRINTVHLVIESLMQQSINADSIILWLGDDVLPNGELSISDLPAELIDRIPRGLDIKVCKDIKSYKKLIPALQAFNDAIIVTVDDDILFPSDWLEKLYVAHIKEPNVIHCHQGYQIGISTDNCLIPYSEWKMGDSISGNASEFIFPIGCGGVLYPPKVFHKDIMNVDLALSLCPTGDDIWFKSMSLINNIKAKILPNRMKNLNYVCGTQNTALWKHNLQKGKNDVTPNDDQIKAVFEHYDLFRFLISNKL
jgi:hypothetical protein